MQGNLFIISAPSGAGKSSLIAKLLEMDQDHNYKLSISHTSREPRPNEQDSVHYYFTSKNEFESLIVNNNFLEYAHVFNNYYGTSRLMVEQYLQQGFDVFLDIDWQGARQVRANFSNCYSIFILPPSLTELENRLRQRGQDSDDIIKHRMQQAKSEIEHYVEYDFVVINDKIEVALQDITNVIKSTKLTMKYQQQYQEKLLAELLAK